MDIRRSGSQPPGKGPAEYFSGAVQSTVTRQVRAVRADDRLHRFLAVRKMLDRVTIIGVNNRL